MWQRFTEKARKVIFYSQEEAQKFGEGYVSTEHLLLGLLREGDGTAIAVIKNLGMIPDRIRHEIQVQLPRGDARPSQDMTLTPRAKRVIDLAYDEARNLNNNYIGTEHLLLGLIREWDGLAGRVLTKLGVELESARLKVIEMQASRSGDRPNAPADPVYRRFPPAHQSDSLGAHVLLGFLMGRFLLHHLLLAMTADEQGVAGKVIRAQCEDISKLQWEIWAGILNASKSGLNAPEPEILDWLLKAASTEAGGGPVGPEHLLLAMLTATDLPIVVFLNGLGITLERSRELVASL